MSIDLRDRPRVAPAAVLRARRDVGSEGRPEAGAKRRAAVFRRARGAVISGILLFLGIQASSAVVLDRWRPELRDPEYGHKLALLRERLAESPDRPLVLALGSSRAEMGFRPEVLPPPSSPGDPLVFNFALSGSGPLQELLCLRRLLAEGIRPDAVLVEVLPPALQEHYEEDRMAVGRLAWRDLTVLDRYSRRPAELRRGWFRSAALPWHTHRYCLLSHLAPAWLPWQVRQDHVWAGLDRLGWLTYPKESIPAARRWQELERARKEYARRLQDFQVADVPDRCLRELLKLCRQEGIGVVLFLMPEGTEFRGWYAPASLAALDDYLGRLCGDYGVPLIDARLWAADDAFIDSHHLLPNGAAEFTQRFGRQVMQPFAAERRLP